MTKIFSSAAFLLLLLCSCTPGKKTALTPKAALPSPDTFRTAQLFFLPPEKQLLYYQNIDQILPTSKIEKGSKMYPLVEAPIDLPNFSFQYKDTLRTLNSFMQETNVVGLIVIKNDSILLEKYREGTTPSTKWINFSVAKSVTSLLYGAAIQDGYIPTLEEKVSHYVPELKGSVYDSVSLRNLLQMSSGVAWNEDARNLQSDLMRVGMMERERGWDGIVAYLSSLKRAAPPGQKFNYNTVETSLAGLILKRIIKKPLAEYLSEKIWKPFGMKEDANWVKSRSIEMETGGCCISATLRDYALLGMFAMNNGVTREGKQVLPANWMKESTTPAKSMNSYGYYWWLRESGRFFASGAYGQQIEIDPSQKLVIAVQSYWPIIFSNYYLGYLDSMIEAVASALKTKPANR